MTRPFRLEAPRASENDIEAGCLTVLRLRGYWVARLHAGTFKTVDGQRWIKGNDKGTPDWVAMRGKRGLLLEVKRPGAKLSLDQQRKIAELRTDYGLPIVVVSDAFQLSAWLDQHERSP